MGGLGNQMFQYAFYLKLKNVYEENLKADLSFFCKQNCHNGYELKRIFNIDMPFATVEECYFSGKKCIGEISHSRLLKFAYRIYYNAFLSKHMFPPYSPYHRKDNEYKANGYYEDMFDDIYKYYGGYWQNELYFRDISDLIRDAFVFPKLDSYNLELAKLITAKESVSLHIRRGDYLTAENSVFQNICTPTYYKNAVSYMNSSVANPYYFIFSNDIEWCKNNLNLDNMIFVDWNIGVDSYKDMQLMSLCKHNIIANSSFSWWGAWLNNNPNKVVCAPKRWYNNEDTVYGECPDSWVRIEID